MRLPSDPPHNSHRRRTSCRNLPTTPNNSRIIPLSCKRFLFAHDKDIEKLAKDIEKLNVGGLYLTGFLFALTTHLGNVLSMIPDTDSYPVQFQADLAEFDKERLTKMGLAPGVIEFVRGTHSAHERILAQFDMRHEAMKQIEERNRGSDSTPS